MRIDFYNMNGTGSHCRVGNLYIPLFRSHRKRSANGHVPAHYVWTGTVNGHEIRGTARAALRTQIEKALSRGPVSRAA
jgi:hypothetical protein